jgi:hypothetical protein
VKWTRGILIVAVSAVIASPAWACSICRCGDPTFSALGQEGVAQAGLRLAFDWDLVKKTQGSPSDDFDSLREERSTLLVAYGVTDSVGIFARLPYSKRDLTETEGGVAETTHNSGLADPEFQGQMRLWHSDFEGDVGIRSSLYAVVGLKSDWGKNNASVDGERLDEHVQSGTGSTDWFAGLAGSYQINPRSAVFASTQYRHTGRNDFGYRYGRAMLLNLAYDYKISTRWDAVIEANYRSSGRDQVDELGTTDPNTGGSITYLTPRVLFDVGNGWVARASAQIPVSDSHLHGYQNEKTIVNLGVTWLFQD